MEQLSGGAKALVLNAGGRLGTSWLMDTWVAGMRVVEAPFHNIFT